MQGGKVKIGRGVLKKYVKKAYAGVRLILRKGPMNCFI